MKRLGARDKALVLTLLPLLAAGLALSVKTQLQGGGVALIGLLVEDDESHPVVTGDYSLLHATNPLEAAGLRAGDVLIRVGDADLRGAGSLRFTAQARSMSRAELSVPLVYEREGLRRETSLGLVPVSSFRSRPVMALASAAMAMFLLLRTRPSPALRALVGAALAFAFSGCFFPGGWLQTCAWATSFAAGAGLTVPLALRFLLLFPDDVSPGSRWHRIWPWLFVAPGPFVAALLAGRFTVGEAGLLVTAALGTAAILAVGTHNYRLGDALAKRQIKWILFGLYCSGLPFVTAAALGAVEPSLGWLSLASIWAFPLLPLSVLVSVARYNFLDIDRVLSATASYNVLLVLLVGAGLVVVPRAADAASSLLGIDTGSGQVALSLLLAGVVVPAQRRLRPQLDRLFFKERYALDHGIAELLTALSACADARELTQRLGEGLTRLLRPETCAIYAPVGLSYAPVFARGHAVPPAFEASSPFVGTLHERRRPLALAEAGRRPDAAALGPFDRAALETLQAEVVVPVRRDQALAAFLCLGPKRSGDVYTATDLSLLAAVAETVSQQLQLLERDEVIREGRAMQASLRRYVPGAVAEELAGGAELRSGEREISVLFVDIRGYTRFSESRGAEEIFGTVNRYTETVSEIVRRRGGAVVEFNGDGMMAVFGAPRELAHKERAAVEAGREIAAAVDGLLVGKPEARETQLSVGVGIATGEAFVGNIQAVDRMIWTAIGNTTNLAARLQGLTRELAAALVIDRATWERARDAAAGFEARPGVPIRGRRDAQDVYVLPLPARA